jgi:hypothetical protein
MANSKQKQNSNPEEKKEKSSSGQESPVIGTRSDSCTQYFDKMWFCYTPAHQFRHYYIYGLSDDCKRPWGELWDCLKQKTNRYKDQEAPNKTPTHPLWELRTKEQAEKFWNARFSQTNKRQSRIDC